MKSLFVTKAYQLEEFRSEFEKRAGNPLNIEYLSRAKVRAFYKGNLLVGGYVINTTHPFRYAGWVPEPIRDEVLAAGAMQPGQAVEITCIWMRKGGVSKLERDWIYIRSVLDALFAKRKFIFGGSVKPVVARIQMQVLRRLIYSGPVALPQDPVGQIYCAHRSEMVFHMALKILTEGFGDIRHWLAKSLFAPRKRRVATQGRVI